MPRQRIQSYGPDSEHTPFFVAAVIDAMPLDSFHVYVATPDHDALAQFDAIGPAFDYAERNGRGALAGTIIAFRTNTGADVIRY